MCSEMFHLVGLENKQMMIKALDFHSKNQNGMSHGRRHGGDKFKL